MCPQSDYQTHNNVLTIKGKKYFLVFTVCKLYIFEIKTFTQFGTNSNQNWHYLVSKSALNIISAIEVGVWGGGLKKWMLHKILWESAAHLSYASDNCWVKGEKKGG